MFVLYGHCPFTILKLVIILLIHRDSWNGKAIESIIARVIPNSRLLNMADSIRNDQKRYDSSIQFIRQMIRERNAMAVKRKL